MQFWADKIDALRGSRREIAKLRVVA